MSGGTDVNAKGLTHLCRLAVRGFEGVLVGGSWNSWAADPPRDVADAVKAA